MAKTVEISIDESGEVTLDLSGFHGQGCAKVFQDFAGDDKAKLTRNKPEIRECATEAERQKQ
jgi:hypothetical protein